MQFLYLPTSAGIPLSSIHRYVWHAAGPCTPCPVLFIVFAILFFFLLRETKWFLCGRDKRESWKIPKTLCLPFCFLLQSFIILCVSIEVPDFGSSLSMRTGETDCTSLCSMTTAVFWTRELFYFLLSFSDGPDFRGKVRERNKQIHALFLLKKNFEKLQKLSFASASEEVLSCSVLSTRRKKDQQWELISEKKASSSSSLIHVRIWKLGTSHKINSGTLDTQSA